MVDNDNHSHYDAGTMIVCLCHRISDRDIAAAVAAGCTSFDALQDDLRIGTACGCCLECAHETFRAHAADGGAGCPGAARCGAQPLALAA